MKKYLACCLFLSLITVQLGKAAEKNCYVLLSSAMEGQLEVFSGDDCTKALEKCTQKLQEVALKRPFDKEFQCNLVSPKLPTVSDETEALYCTYNLENEWNETLATVTKRAPVRNRGTIRRKVCDLAHRECEALACALDVGDSYCVKKEMGLYDGPVEFVDLIQEARDYGEYEGKQNCGSRYISRYYEDCYYGWGNPYGGGWYNNYNDCFYGGYNCHYGCWGGYSGSSCNYLRRGGSYLRRLEAREELER